MLHTLPSSVAVIWSSYWFQCENYETASPCWKLQKMELNRFVQLSFILYMRHCIRSTADYDTGIHQQLLKRHIEVPGTWFLPLQVIRTILVNVTEWIFNLNYNNFFSMVQQALLGQGLIIKASQSHSDTPYLVGLLWTSDQPDTETSTWQHRTLTRDRRLCPQRDLNPQSQHASGRITTIHTQILVHINSFPFPNIRPSWWEVWNISVCSINTPTFFVQSSYTYIGSLSS
jgi:hypothetical protein